MEEKDGVYFKYNPGFNGIACWVVSSDPSGEGKLAWYNTKYFDLDEAIKQFKIDYE